jgi:murein DD-endopeptidase MepM/ murein hydrolase activator NlpD
MEMQRRKYYVSFAVVAVIIILTMILVPRFAKPSEYCSPSEYIDLSQANVYASDADMPFRFPVDDLTPDQLFGANFADYGYGDPSPYSKKYHAAEDYHQPAGSPVYASADGVVSYSGPRGGYGWLIIVDHPDLNLYSLYGHLSPSRWKIDSGPVQKGELIGYLGDPDENGGSEENPLTPHLHFGIRLGQRIHYPTVGEWRWMAGWIKYCPQALGWLQPSKIITEQDIPDGGFHHLGAPLWPIWWQELLLSLLILTGAIAALTGIATSRNTAVVISYGIVLPLLTWYTFSRGFVVAYALLAVCVVFVAIRLSRFIRQRRSQPSSNRAD